MKYLTKTIEYGLYLLVFLLPLGTRWIIRAGETEYLTYSLYGTDILLVLLLALFAVLSFRLQRSGRRNPLYSEFSPLSDSSSRSLVGMTIKKSARNDKIGWFFIFGLVFTSAVSVFFALDKALALYKFGWLVLGAGLFWLVSQAAYSRVKLVGSLLVGLGFQAGLGIWQFLAQATFANKWLGLALHRASDLGTSVVETVGADGVGERWLRAYGGLDHPNMLGGMLAIGILLLIGQYIKFPISNNQFPNKFQISNFKFQNYLKVIFWFLLVIFSTALFFSFSRAAWLALAAGLIVMMLGAAINKNLPAQKNILQTVLISGLMFFILFFQFPNLVMTRLYSGQRLEIKSKSERLESIKNSWPIIKNNWASGVGAGNYTLALERQLPGEQSYFYQPAHNVFILVFSEIGLFGLLFFILIIIFPFVRLLRRREYAASRNDSKLAILVALIVVMSLDHWLWSLHFGMLFFWLALGLAHRDSCG